MWVRNEVSYSNARLGAIVKSLTETGKRIRHSDLYQAITQNTPDISKEDLELFKRNVEYLRPIL